MAGGIGPLRLLLLRSKRVRSRNAVKLNWASVPLRLALERFISETVPDESQTMVVQLQRFLRLVRDHELKGGGVERLFFHLIRASACVVGDAVMFTESKERKRM